MSILTKLSLTLLILISSIQVFSQEKTHTWIRISQMGYSEDAAKVAVLGSKNLERVKSFELVDAATSKVILKKAAGRNFGEWAF